MRVYLAGPIEHAPDGGRSWREALTPFLVQTLGHEVYDPAKDERKSLTESECANFRSWKTTQPERFRDTVRKIIDYDLDILSRTDYVICHWDESAMYGGGTQGELTFARHRRIPVYMVRSMPLERISGWVLGCCDHVFTEFRELQVYLVCAFSAKK